MVSLKLAKLEQEILRIQNGRGNLNALAKTGSLEAACHCINTNIKKQIPIVIATGFPCCAGGTQETDGIAGAIAVARATKGAIVIEENVVQCVEQCLKQLKSDVKVIALEKLTVEKNYLLVCLERAGIAADGNTYTMSGQDVSQFCADASGLFKNASQTVAIGDGGNELGLGGCNEATKAHIPLGAKIGCSTEFSADNIVIAGVSNWGGYAIALGLSLLRDVTVPDTNSERTIAEILKQFGICDGVTGKCELTVDGMSLEKHLEILNGMTEIVKRDSHSEL